MFVFKMRISKSHLKKCAKIKDDLFPSSEIKIFRKNADHKSNKNVTPTATSAPLLASSHKSNPDKSESTTNSEYRENEIKIQMLSKSLYEQIFKQSPQRKVADDNLIEKYVKDLLKHGIKVGESPKLPDVNLKLPPFEGKDIEEHFLKIATDQSQSYLKLINALCEMKKVPDFPSEWSTATGWTFYHKNGPRSVPYPNEAAMIFDTEVCMNVERAHEGTENYCRP